MLPCTTAHAEEGRGKARRRVSFTTATTFAEDMKKSAAANNNNNKSRPVRRRASLDFPMTSTTTSTSDCWMPLNDTPIIHRQRHQEGYQENGDDRYEYMEPLNTNTNLRDGGVGRRSSATSATSSLSAPSMTPATTTSQQRQQQQQQQRRRSSMGSTCTSASSYSNDSIGSSANNSATGHSSSYASQLSFRDESTRRAKVMECVQWLSRHLAHSVVLELMDDIVSQQHTNREDDDNDDDETTERRPRNSTASTASHNSSARGRALRRSSTGNTSTTTFASRPHQHNNHKRQQHMRRRSSSFFHCETPDHMYDSNMDASNKSEHSDRKQQRLEKTRVSLDRLSITNHCCISDCNMDEEEDAMYVLSGYGESASSSVSSGLGGDYGYDDEEDPEEDNAMTAFQLSSSPSSPLCLSSRIVPHDSALVMVDISGFTKLSTSLPLQALSSTINTYFQSLVQCIQQYGGDIVKFAGDAIIAEWRCHGEDDDVDEDTGDGDDNTKDGKVQEAARIAVETAAACACHIIETCSDYHVYQQDKNNNNARDNTVTDANADADAKEHNSTKAVLATLNVHCGIGYGTMLEFHVGDETKREYLLLGDAIPQAGEAIALGKSGEVVASPQAYQMLLTTTTPLSATNGNNESKVIFSSREDSSTNDLLLDPSILQQGAPSSFVEKPLLETLLQDWDYPELVKLQKRMSLYVHPAVVDGELFTTIFHNRASTVTTTATSSFDSDLSSPSAQQLKNNSHHHEQRMLQSEAEIRPVYTLFLQPLINVDITGDPAQDEATLVLLNQIMVLANRELTRFKGHLRQYIVDDKGIVLIANFGLRGSVFPQMIEEHAMPFAASLQSALWAELNVECRMGATFGTAYCGVVGGLERHEYSVLGPSVNLAARLMGNPGNNGFLVDEGVRQEAENWEFEALEPVPAKGYADPVPIFEPISHNRSPWKRAKGIFVGREEELNTIVDFADDLVESGCTTSKMVLMSASTGFGKSLLMSEAINQIRLKCVDALHPHLILGQVCCEGDLFQPLSVFGPVFLDTLARTMLKLDHLDKPNDDLSPAIETVHGPGGTAVCENKTAKATQQFYAACQRAEIPQEHIMTIYSLVFHHEWPSTNNNDLGVQEDNPSQSPSVVAKEEIAKLIVSIFLQSTVEFDVVIVAVDDMSFMDEISWKVIQLLFEHACNVLVIGTSRPTTCKGINIDPRFWKYLFDEGARDGRFVHIELHPLRESDVRRLIIHHLEQETGSTGDEKKSCSDLVEEQFSHEVYLQSGGNPRLVAGMVEKYASLAMEDDQSSQDSKERDQEYYEGIMEKSTKKASALDLDISEHVLQRLDSLPASVRTHLNLGAIIGSSFNVRDTIRVMESYRGVPAEDRVEHAEFVNDSLNEAVWRGILEVEEELVDTGDDDLLPNTKYRFTHEMWRNHIIDLTLDEWQQDMQKLISSID